jgi:phenylalanyl-tRNA synthetase beta chain
LEQGYPTHAFDADRIRGEVGKKKIIVRRSKAGESLPLLDGSTITLDGSEVVVADSGGAIGLGGIMGGGNSEVQEGTQNLFLECAEFDPVLVRKTSSRHQKKTDAAHRFERGVDPRGAQRTLPRLVHLVQQLAGGKVIGATHSVLPVRQPDSKVYKKEVRFDLHYINEFLGFERDQAPLQLQDIQRILEGLDCSVSKDDKEWIIHPPTYRLDLNIREDFAEEVARSVGYDKIPATLPSLRGTPVFAASSSPRVKVMERAKESLVRSGFHEAINLAFTSKSWLSRFGLSSSVPLVNPLSEEYEVMVPSLIPGLVRNTVDNWNKHFGSEPLAIRLFELRPTFSAQGVIQAQGQMETGVNESWKLGIALSGPRYANGLRFEQGEVDFYDLKAVVDSLLTALGTRGVRLIPFSASRTGGHPLFHPGQSAEILVGNSVAGHFGLLHPAKSRELKTRAPLWIAELDWEVLSKLSRKASEAVPFQQWSEHPPMERDFALLVKNDVTAEKLCQVALKAGKPLAKTAKIFDVYRGSQVAEGMTSIAVRVIFYHEQRSLQEAEVEAASAKILESWKKELGAELRS